MRVKVIGGAPTLHLEKSETSRLLDAGYILKRMAMEITDANAKAKLTEGAAIVEAAGKKFGGNHLNADGTLKLSPRAKVVEEGAPGHA